MLFEIAWILIIGYLLYKKMKKDGIVIFGQVFAITDDEEMKKAIDIFYSVKKLNYYYCYECGTYVDKNSLSFKCSNCGAGKIGVDQSTLVWKNFFNKGFGGMFASYLVMPKKFNEINVYKEYLRSEYYKSTNIPFDRLITDKGKVGEYYIEKEVNLLRKKGYEAKILYNVMIPEPNGSFQEADAILIVGTNIFVIESKNRTGHFEISSADAKYWMLNQHDAESNVYSPIWQNEQHIAALMHYLKLQGIEYNEIFNLIVLGGKSSYNIQRGSDKYTTLLFGNETFMGNIMDLADAWLEFYVKKLALGKNCWSKCIHTHLEIRKN